MGLSRRFRREPEPATGDTGDTGNRGEQRRVHEWRAAQLRRLGLSHAHADVFADRVDWHAVADLVARGCEPALALKIVR